MIASLQMYDRPETARATDRFWMLVGAELAHRGIEAPDALDRSPDIASAWSRSDLLLSQTCSLPFRMGLAGQAEIVGTPDIKLDGCLPGHYCSVLIAREGDPRGRPEDFDGSVLAYNDETSQSGWAAPMADAAKRGITFRGFRRTGSHDGSSIAVAEGIADIAAIDAHSWHLIRRFCASAARLRVVGRTESTPGLPLITTQRKLVEQLFESVSAAIELADPADLELLPFRGLVRIPEERYLELPFPPPVPTRESGDVGPEDRRLRAGACRNAHN